ncbi:MAG: hypothetical protein LBT85_02720 [Bifidobacteriaceae bacterium]|jgi:DNA polymerase-3 subunit delta|nr:hypothetical protein [Bifidobacteriaceae bacterium]
MKLFILITASAQPIIRQNLDRALEYIKQQLPDLKLSNLEKLDANGLDSPAFESAVSASLFSTSPFVYLKNLQEASAQLTDSIFKIVEQNVNSVIIFQHSGARKGTKLLNLIKANSNLVLEGKAIKNSRDRLSLVKNIFLDGKISISTDAIRVLVEAFGEDVDELDAASRQLINDFADKKEITVQDINSYFDGRKQIRIFEISDAVGSGQTAKALDLYHNGIFVGIEPIAVIAVIAMQLRKIAKVQAIVSKKLNPADLKMTPWQVGSAKKYLPLWNTKNLSLSFYKLASVEQTVKTNSKIDKNYLVEQLIVDICSIASK